MYLLQGRATGSFSLLVKTVPMASRKDTCFTAEAWEADSGDGWSSRRNCRMPLLQRKPAGGRSAKHLKEKQPQCRGQVEAHIKPQNWISWVTFSSDPEVTSGLGAILQGGGGGHHSRSNNCWVANHRRGESDHLQGGPVA